jgi:hypothetical protein
VPFDAPVPASSINAAGGASSPVLFGSTLYFLRGQDIYQASIPEAGTGVGF